MVWRRLAGEMIYAGFAGLLVATVATAFTVVAVGLPLVVGLDGVLLASAASIVFGSIAAGVSIFGHLDRESGIESVRAP